MPKAGPSCSKITRRAAIAGTLTAAVPALAGVALPALAPPVAPAPDPVLAAITAHRDAIAALDAAARHLSDVEEGLVDDGGQDRGSGADDDPLLLAAIAAFDAACDAETQTAWALARLRPACLAGAAALLRYAGDVEADGNEWPESPEDCCDADWASTFHHNVAAALALIADSP
jgi:hypothetical protein